MKSIYFSCCSHTADAELEYFSWADGEPNGATDGKVCIQLSGFDSPTSGDHTYDWNDEDCSKASYSDSGKQNFFICEFGKKMLLY